MKKLLSDSILMAAISACLSLLFIYFILSMWGKNGFNEFEFLLILIIPGFVFFIVTFFVNLFLLRRYLKEERLKSTKRTHWGKIFVILSILVVAFSIIFDYLYNSINNNLSNQLGVAMGEMLLELGSSQEEVKAFSKMPIFLQGFFPNTLGVVFGCFFASYFNRKVRERKEKHQITA